MARRKIGDDAREFTRKDMIQAEREVGENIPDEMVGLDTEDVGDVDTSRH